MIFRGREFERFVMFLSIGNIGLVLLDFEVGKFWVVRCFEVGYFGRTFVVVD